MGFRKSFINFMINGFDDAIEMNGNDLNERNDDLIVVLYEDGIFCYGVTNQLSSLDDPNTVKLKIPYLKKEGMNKQEINGTREIISTIMCAKFDDWCKENPDLEFD